MPPWMPPILTGDHPLPENGVINAPVRTIVKWQSLYRGSDDGDMPRISAELVERCPQFFYTFNLCLADSKSGKYLGWPVLSVDPS